MFKDVITYTNFNDEEVSETVYFNLNKAELIEMEVSTPGGISNVYRDMLEKQDQGELIKAFKDLVAKSYGVKSSDGSRFIKKKELTDEFLSSEVYSEFFMKLLTDPEYANKFIIGILPKIEGLNVQEKLDEYKTSDEYRKLLGE